VAIDAGYFYSLGIKQDGSIVVWGSCSGINMCDVPSPNAGFITVAAGPEHGLAIQTINLPPVSIIGSWETGTTHAKEAGSNRAFVVIVHAEGVVGVNPAINTVTYGGRTMTKINDKSQNSFGFSSAYVGAFILDEANIAIESGDNINVTWTAAPATTSLTSVFLKDVNQAALVGANANKGVNNNANIAANALATKDGDMVIEGATCTEAGTYIANNGFTEDIEVSDTYSRMDGHKDANGASEIASLTHSTTTNRQALVSFVVNAGVPGKAIIMTPSNGSTEVSFTADLNWTTDDNATSYDVYFGTTNPPPLVSSNQTATTYDTGIMDTNTTYYWRIDEKNAAGTTAGDVWSFTVIPLPGQSVNTIPANGATDVYVTTDLKWTAGAYAKSHDIYFGTVVPPPFVGNQAGTTYDTGTMATSTTYYWRIDEKNASGTTTGILWSFTTGELEPGLDHWWKFDEGTGNIAYDTGAWPIYVGATNGTIYGATWTTGRLDGALSFDGVDDYVHCGTKPTNYGNNMTVSAWMKTSTFGTVVSNRDAVLSLDRWYTLFSNALEIGNNNDGYKYLTFNTPTLDGEWHHIAFTKTGTNFAIYVDGVLDQSFISNALIIRYDQVPLLIGKRWSQVENLALFNGIIDDVRMYEKALSEAEIASLASGTPSKATEANPANGATGVSSTDDLSWTAGARATSHDVYFGTTNPPPLVSSNQTATTYDTGTMDTDTVYYWRIDEKNAGGTTTGYVWSFTTVETLPSQASNPTPANGAINVGTTTDLSWIAGDGAASHDVYFGTVSPGTFQSNQTGTTFDTGTMANSTTYYWRVDEKNTVGTTTGEVWSFTTMAAPPPAAIIGSWVTGTTHAKEAGTNRALVFIAHAEHTGSVALNSVKYGGRSMTKIVEKIITSGATRTYVAAFILNDAGIIAATSTTFTPSWSATPYYGTSYESVFLQNVNQWTLTGATATNATASGSTITTSALANSIGDMIIDAATNSNTGTYTTNNSFTKAVDLSRTNFDGVGGYKAATGASETPSVTHSPSNGRQSLIGFVVKGPDTTPPTPSPMTWATVPHATSATSISMTATTASDLSGVEYYFECISGGNGHDSDWQAGATYEDTDLVPNTQYTYRVKVRDKSSVHNETEWSTSQSVTTLLPPVIIIGPWVTGTANGQESGISRALVFIAHAEHSGSVTLNSVTYGGQAMTKVVEAIVGSGATRTYVAAFILNDAGINAATSTTFSTSWSSTPYYGTSYESVFLDNVNQSILTGATATNATSSGSTITTSALANSSRDMILDAATCSSTGSYTVNNGFTEALELSRTNFDGVAGYKSATGANETPSVRHSTSSSRQSLVGFVVNAVQE
jgi:chemotaxis receptor (MCP) glutamine deamidase CheD